MQLRRISLMFFISLVMAVSMYFVCTKMFSHVAYIAELQIGLASMYMWIPGICALIYMKRDGNLPKIFKRPTKYCWIALALPAVIVALGIIYTFPFAQFSTEGILEVAQKYPIHFASSTLTIAFFVFSLYGISALSSVSINFIVALGEELFWRGYLWEQVKHKGFWRASLYIGLLWGLWHAPFILLFGLNYPQHRWLGVVWMIVCSVLMAPMFTYFRMKDKSLMAPTILHGMFNAFSPICVVFFPGAHELLSAPVGLAGMLAFLSINGYFLLRERRRILLAHVS